MVKMHIQPLSKRAEKFFSKQDVITKERIIKAIDKLQWFPPSADIKQITGYAGEYRMRVGKIRIIYDMDFVNKLIFINVIEYRGDAYK